MRMRRKRRSSSNRRTTVILKKRAGDLVETRVEIKKDVEKMSVKKQRKRETDRQRGDDIVVLRLGCCSR